MSLRFYNTMGRKLQDFVPVKKGCVGFYGCGPTVYNYAHIGNLRAYVFLDTLHRTFKFLNYDVTHVMNITDIGHLSGDTDDGEDKMLKTAKERGQSVLDIAQFYTDAFYADTDRLNILRPSIVCKATDHIADMIALISRLEEKGHTYMAGGNLYFDVSTFADYGKLAMLNLDDLKSGARISVDANKRNPYDFVLWFTKSKFENHALVWDSPWGKGYPGWHIECSAMSIKYLGETIDIHTGGIDHIPIHHTNEIAQSEGATGKKWVNYWLHNEFLVIAKQNDSENASQKMSKSEGNFLTLQSLVEAGYDPLDYRFFLLCGHYRTQLAFSWNAMDSAKNSRAALMNRIAKIIDQAGIKNEAELHSLLEKTMPTEHSQGFIDQFKEALEDDLSLPRALSELQMAIKDTMCSVEEKIAIINQMDSVLGLSLLKITAKPKNELSDEQMTEITLLIEQRNEAKKTKNYALADEIRTKLQNMDIVLEDSPSGTTWKKI
ncbi:MAG: cysteine--tRNA ligase [Treponemataceae bacterium]